MKIVQLLKSEVTSLNLNSTLFNAGKEIEANRMAAVFVEDGKPVGIITRRDYIRLLLNGTKQSEPVFRHAKKEIVKIRHDRSAEHALAILIDHNIRRIVVVNDNGDYVGLISYDDIVDMMAWVKRVAQLRAFHMLKNDGFLAFSPETTLYECAKEMLDLNQNVAVVTRDNKPVGIVTESDIIASESTATQLGAPLRVVMHQPITVGEDENIDNIMQLMQDRGVHSVVVVRSDGEFSGVITSKSIAKSMEGNYNLFLEYKVQVLRETLDHAPYMILEMEKDESCNYFIYWANHVSLEHFGQELLGTHPVEIFKEQWEHSMKMFSHNGKIERQLISLDGKAYEFSLRKIYDDKLQCTLNDITSIQRLKDDAEQARNDAVLAEEAIRHANAVLYKTLNSIDALIYVIDIETHEILFINGYAQSIFGSAFGKVCYQALQENQNAPCDFCPLSIDPSKKELGSNYYWENQNSTNGRWYRYSDRIIKWVDGRKVKIQVGFDITDTKDAQLELESLNYQLSNQIDEEQQKSSIKDTYLVQQSRLATMGSMMSAITHQWRQPLNSLMLAVQDLTLAHQHGDINEEYIKQSVDSMIEQLMLMNSTVDDFREFYRPHKAKEEFNVAELVNRGLGFIKDKVSRLKVTIAFEQANGTYLTNGYQNELLQAVLNIFNNALENFEINHVSDPYIAVSLEQDNDCIELSILDNGGGFEEHHIDSLFEPFFTTKDSKKGTGLGLYLVKTIVEKISGEVEAKNSESGACFKIRLPKN